MWSWHLNGLIVATVWFITKKFKMFLIFLLVVGVQFYFVPMRKNAICCRLHDTGFPTAILRANTYLPRHFFQKPTLDGWANGLLRAPVQEYSRVQKRRMALKSWPHNLWRILVSLLYWVLWFINLRQFTGRYISLRSTLSTISLWFS